MKQFFNFHSFFLLAFVATIVFLDPVSAQESSLDEQTFTSMKVEPGYIAKKPKFLLATFGENHEKKMWMVLDKSNKDAKFHDVLYVDVNGNGDMTEQDEKFALVDEDGDAIESIKIPDQKISKESSFTKIAILFRDHDTCECMIKATLNEKIKFGGGYPERGEDGYMCFGNDKDVAPVVSFKGAKPFEFQVWGGSDLAVGKKTDLSFFMGHRGKGHASFCSTLGHILDKDDYLVATLKYVDTNGAEKRHASKLKERC